MIGISTLVVAALLLVVVANIGPQDSLVIRGLQSLAGYDAKAPFGYERIAPVNGKCPRGYRMDATRRCARPLSAPTPTPTPTPSAVANASKITIAAAYGSGVPANAIDGRVETMWNSGSYAPQTITLDLGNYYTVSSLRFNVQKTPNGTASHKISAGACPNAYAYSQTFSETATTGQWQAVSTAFGGAVRYIAIETATSPSWVAWNEIEAYGVPASFTGQCGAGTGGGSGDGGYIPPVPVAGCISGAVTAAVTTLRVDQTTTLSSDITGQTIIYESSDPAIVKVSNRTVTAVGSGIATVSGKYISADKICYLSGTQITVRPQITGIQGYDERTQTYSNSEAVSGQYVILYGWFSAGKDNTVEVDGAKGEVKDQTANQINVRIPSGAGTVSFTVTNRFGTSNTRSIRVVADEPQVTPSPTPTPRPTPTPLPTLTPKPNAPPKIDGIQGYDSVTQTYSNTQAIVGEFIALYGSFSPNKDNSVSYGSIDYQDASRINIRAGALPGVAVVSVTSPSGTSNTVTIPVVARTVPTPTPTPAPHIDYLYGYDSLSSSPTGTNQALAGEFVILNGTFSPNHDNQVSNGVIDYQDAKQINVRLGRTTGQISFTITNPYGTSNTVSIAVVNRPQATPVPTPTPTPKPTTTVQYDLSASATDPTVCAATGKTGTLTFSGTVRNAPTGISNLTDGVTVSKDGQPLVKAGFIEVSPGTYVTSQSVSSYTVSSAGMYSVSLVFNGEVHGLQVLTVSQQCSGGAQGSLSASYNPILVYSGSVGATTLTARNTGSVNLTLDADGVSYILLPDTTRQVVISVPVGISKIYSLHGGSFSETILVSAQQAQ